MKTLETRYRDIPFEEVIKCATRPPAKGGAEVWEGIRGRPLRVLLPPCTGNHASEFRCKGPFYQNADKPSHCVCVHIAEIGD